MCLPETDWSCPDTCNHTPDTQSPHSQPLEGDDRKRAETRRINYNGGMNGGGGKRGTEEGRKKHGVGKVKRGR